jgi:hypothetical protein
VRSATRTSPGPYVLRDCPFCEGGRALASSGPLDRPVHEECGRCDGEGKRRSYLYPKPKGWRGPWPPPMPDGRGRLAA